MIVVSTTNYIETDCNLESLHVIMIIIIIKFTYGSTGSVSRIFVLLMISGSV